jgi:two-component system chemotaxis response regulator CheB
MPERAWHYAGADYILPISGIEQLLLNSVNGRGNGHRAKARRLPSEKRLEGTSGSKALAVETQHADIENPPVKEQLGMPSVYACPDCHGVLWEIEEGNLLRFRCRVGHAYTAETLNIAMSQATEDTLWASMRALEEKAHLLRRMASRSAESAAVRYEEEAETCDNHAGAIRSMLAQEANSKPVTGQNDLGFAHRAAHG